jgi:hypothetical protein
VHWLCALSVGPSLFTSETWNEDRARFSWGDSPPWANLALLPPIGDTPTGFQRGNALGTAKREAPAEAELRPPTCAGVSQSCSIFRSCLVKRDGKMERKSTSTRKLALRDARRLRVREVAKTIDPPTIDQKVGCSLVASITQIGFRIGSMILMMAASRARTCRIASE